MSGTDADHRPVPAESDAPDLPITLPKNKDANEESQNQEDDESILPRVHIPEIPFVGRLDNRPPTPTHPSISQPFHSQNTSIHQTYPFNDNARLQPMLEPEAHMRVIHAWMVAVRQVISLRDTILTIRMDIKREKTRCSQQEEFFQNVMDTFMGLLNSAVEHNTYPQSKSELDDLARRMKHSREDLRILRQRSNDMEDALSRNEYQLTKLEEELYHQIDLEYRTNSTQPALTSSHTSLATEQQPKVNGSASSPNPRDELYSRMGDFRILLDRLNEFEYELRLELDERDLLRASGQIQISDDATFFEETRNHRAKLQRELDDAQADVERLKQVCTRKGIEFEDVQFHSPLYMEHELEEADSVLSTQAEAARLPLPPSPSGIVDDYFSSRERVDRWLDDPSSVGTLLTGLPAQDPDADTRHGSLCSSDWVLTQSWPRERRPSSSRSARNGVAKLDAPPQWVAAPPPGSEHIAALLKDSMMELGSHSHKSI